MKRPDTTRVAAAWLIAQANLWSHHELARLIEQQPLDAWRVIESMIARTDDQETLKMIGIGPVEDLLSDNGPAVIDEVERFARSEPKLLVCLRAAWKSTSPDEVWARVQRLMEV